MFTLTAHVLGNEHVTSAASDGAGSIIVTTAHGQERASSARDAMRIARRDMGEFLLPARRPGRPWGLHVQVGQVQAVYGEWPLLPGRPTERRSTTPVTRIRDRWHDSGPISALENALEIIKAYTGSSGRAAA